MIPRVTAIAAFACTVQVTAAYSASLAIKVINEQNNGVYSEVFYDDGTQRTSFLKTDQKGVVPNPPATCGKMRTLYAHPFDSGSYFDSPLEPCGSKVVLRVLSRHTPIGHAITFQMIPFTLPDGSPGVITLKAALQSKSSDVPKTSLCEVTLKALADQQVFKIEGEDWVSVKEATTAFSNVFSDAKQPDLQTVTLPYTCNKVGGRVRTLQSNAADRLATSASKKAVMLYGTLKSLGFQ